MTSQHKDLSSQHKDLTRRLKNLTSQHNYLTSDGRSMPPYLLSLMIDTHKKDTKQISLGKQICKQPDFLANGADLIDRRET